VNSAWGISWLGSWGSSWGPLHEVEEQGGPGKSGKPKSKRVYLERDGQILLFRNAHHAAAYVAAEKAQEPKLKSTPKRVRKTPNKVRPISEPVRIEIPVLESFVARYELKDNVSELIRKNELDALIALHLKVMQLRDEEDIEILLLAA
jgi:hypothetical protein